MARTPELTDLDRRVLERVPVGRGLRHAQIARLVWRGAPTLQQENEVRLILRGLEHFGLVEEEGGWWRRRPEPVVEQPSLLSAE